MAQYLIDVYFCPKCKNFHHSQDNSIDAFRYCPYCGEIMTKVNTVQVTQDETMVVGGYF